jgi:hypothetical protein
MSRDYRDYVDPTVSEDDDDGTMPRCVAELADAVIGHRIVKVDGDYNKTRLHLDDGRTVALVGESDCCAFTDVEAIWFAEHLPSTDHLITSVATTDGYTRWHILADAGSVLELTVGWSCGNPFYYTYGLTVTVEPLPAAAPATDSPAGAS